MAGYDWKEDVKTIMKAFDFAVVCENTVKAWDKCCQQTIAKCFTKAGFIAGPLPEPEPAPPPPRNVWENIHWVLEANMSFDEYTAYNDDVETCEPLTDETIIKAVVSQRDDGSTDPKSSDDPLELDGDDSESNPDTSRQPQEEEIIWTSTQFLRYVAQAKAYVLQNKLPKRQLKH